MVEVGKLVVVGFFDGVDGWCGMFIFVVKDIDEVCVLMVFDLVIVKGEMVVEFYKYYGLVVLMLVFIEYEKVVRKLF